jgi:hypothetical protein
MSVHLKTADADFDITEVYFTGYNSDNALLCPSSLIVHTMDGRPYFNYCIKYQVVLRHVFVVMVHARLFIGLACPRRQEMVTS